MDPDSDVVGGAVEWVPGMEMGMGMVLEKGLLELLG